MRRFHLSLVTIVTVVLAALIGGQSRAADPLPGSIVSFDVPRDWPTTTPGEIHVVCNPDLRDLGNYDGYQWNPDHRFLIELYDKKLGQSAHAIVNARNGAHHAAKQAIWPHVPDSDIIGYGHTLDSRGRLDELRPNSWLFNQNEPSAVGPNARITDPELLKRLQEATLRRNPSDPCSPCDPCKKLKRKTMDRMTGDGPLADYVRGRARARGGAYFPRQSWITRGAGGVGVGVAVWNGVEAYGRGGPRAAMEDASWPLSQSPFYRFLDYLNASRGRDGCDANDAMDHAFSPNSGNAMFDPRNWGSGFGGIRPPASPLNTDLGWDVPINPWDR